MLKARELDFSQFAFTTDSDYGRCMISYLDQIYRKSNSVHSQVHYCAILQDFFSQSPRKAPYLYTREDITSYITSPTLGNGRTGKSPSAGTINGRLSVLTGYWKHASNYGILGEDAHLYPLFPYLSPCANVMFAKREVLPDKGMTDSELQAFFAAIGTGTLRAYRDRALFLMYFWCARRRNEILSLRWRDIERSQIIENGVARTAWIYHFRGKGRKNIDDMSEIPDVALNALFQYLDARGIRDTIEPNDYLFTALPSYHGKGHFNPKRPLSDGTVAEIVQGYAQKACIAHPVGCHSFRHTSARAMYSAGASIREVQQKLRHKNLATTSCYLETLCPVSDPTIDRLNAKFANL
jgi:integrase